VSASSSKSKSNLHDCTAITIRIVLDGTCLSLPLQRFASRPSSGHNGPVRQSKFTSQLLPWYETHRRHFPWREPGSGPRHVLLAELLLRQTDAKRVVPVFHRLVAMAPDAAALADLMTRRTPYLLS
jgi:hypothetical protein